MSKLEYQFADYQVQPRAQRKTTYFCRLCREYHIKTRKAHLQNFHNANVDTINRRSTKDLLETIFVESKN